MWIGVKYLYIGDGNHFCRSWIQPSQQFLTALQLLVFRVVIYHLRGNTTECCQTEIKLCNTTNLFLANHQLCCNLPRTLTRPGFVLRADQFSKLLEILFSANSSRSPTPGFVLTAEPRSSTLKQMLWTVQIFQFLSGNLAMIFSVAQSKFSPSLNSHLNIVI